MAGLFSSSEQDLVGNIMTQRQQANQALGSGYGKYGGIVQAAGGLIDTGTDAMFGGKVGAADPRMQQLQDVKAIFAQVTKETGEVNSSAFYEKLAQALSAKYPEQAQKAADKAMEVKKAEFDMKTKADKPSDLKTLLTERANHEEGTPERAYYDAQIKLLTEGKPAAEGASPQIVQLQKARDAIAANNPNDPRIAEIQKQIDKLGAASQGSKVSIDLGTLPSVMAEAAAVAEGKALGTAATETHTKLAAKVAADQASKRVISQLDSALEEAFTGSGANTKASLVKVLGALNVPINKEWLSKASATEVLEAMGTRYLFPLVRNFPGQLANKELERLEKTSPNSLQEPATIRRLVNLLKVDIAESRFVYEQSKKWRESNKGSSIGFDGADANIQFQDRYTALLQKIEQAKALQAKQGFVPQSLKDELIAEQKELGL